MAGSDLCLFIGIGVRSRLRIHFETSIHSSIICRGCVGVLHAACRHILHTCVYVVCPIFWNSEWYFRIYSIEKRTTITRRSSCTPRIDWRFSPFVIYETELLITFSHPIAMMINSINYGGKKLNSERSRSEKWNNIIYLFIGLWCRIVGCLKMSKKC